MGQFTRQSKVLQPRQQLAGNDVDALGVYVWTKTLRHSFVDDPLPHHHVQGTCNFVRKVRKGTATQQLPKLAGIGTSPGLGVDSEVPMIEGYQVQRRSRLQHVVVEKVLGAGG